MKSEKIYIEFLLLKIKAGESSAWDRLLPILQLKVKAMVCKTIGHSASVDDCMQESLLAIYRQVKNLKSVKAFHTWMYRITYNKCMDYGRQVPMTDNSDEVAAGDMSGFELQLDIKAAMAVLSELEQVIIYLFYYEGFNVAEIASVVNQPAGTIKYRLFAARATLKQQLTPSNNQPENQHEY